MVCPTCLIRNWEQEMEKWFSSSLERNIHVASSSNGTGKIGPDADLRLERPALIDKV